MADGPPAGDDAEFVQRQLLVRTDIAGYSQQMLGGLAARNLTFSVGMPANEVFAGHIHRLRHHDWSTVSMPMAVRVMVRRSPSSTWCPTGCPTAPG